MLELEGIGGYSTGPPQALCKTPVYEDHLFIETFRSAQVYHSDISTPLYKEHLPTDATSYTCSLHEWPLWTGCIVHLLQPPVMTVHAVSLPTKTTQGPTNRGPCIQALLILRCTSSLRWHEGQAEVPSVDRWSCS